MIEKIIFRNATKDALVDYMLKGKMKPNERLSLPTIAKELEISVTPVREALTQLTEIGVVHYLANRGFFVAEITEKEAIDLYELIALLECEAIKNSYFDAGDLTELREINTQFSSAQSNTDKIHFDKLFHQKLTEKYQNEAVKKIIEDTRIRIAIYELKYMDLSSVETSSLMHENIIKALERNNREGAIAELKRNWEISIDHLSESTKTKDHDK